MNLMGEIWMNKVKSHLKILNIKQKDFADYIGLKPMTLNNYINERRVPNVDVAWLVATGIKKQYENTGKTCEFEDIFPPDSYTGKHAIQSRQIDEEVKAA